MSDAAWEPLIRSGLFPPPERLPPSEGGPLPPSQGGPSRLLGHMLRNSSIASGTAVGKRAPAWMAGLVHYRLVPGSFPHGMRYHFDGLAEVIRFSFDATGDGGPQSAPSLTWRSMPFESDAFERCQSCLFLPLCPFRLTPWLPTGTSRASSSGRVPARRPARTSASPTPVSTSCLCAGRARSSSCGSRLTPPRGAASTRRRR